MLKAVIVDDEKPSLYLLSKQLEETGEVEIIGSYHLSSEALEMIPQLQPDVVFLEIEMHGLNGIELANTLNQLGIETYVIFITAYPQYALDAFRVYAFHYMLKPIKQSELLETVLRLKKLISPCIKVVPQNKECNTEITYIRCLGSFEVINSKGTLVKWSSKKSKELLAYFIIHKERQLDKWKIGEALWPEDNEEHVNNNFHTTLFRLRDIMQKEGIDLQVGSQKGKKYGYCFQPIEIDCDLFQLDSFMEQYPEINDNSIQGFEQIRRLFRGELFSDIDSLWCLPEKEKYLRMMLHILDAMGNYYIHIGEYNKAYHVISQSLELDYSRERTHQEIFEVFYYLKDKQALINHYQNFANALKRDFATEPDFTTKQVYERYLRKF
ncbi:MAG: response regulator [Herbinix sp.]|nr:response regulator [Herbinix sp.]